MINFCITGTLEEDILEFTINGETKSIDQFTKRIIFPLENKGIYRVYFKQKNAEYIPKQVEKVVKILFLPIKGLFNIITFNVDSIWEEKISGFRVSGYTDIKIERDIEIKFQYQAGYFDKLKECFNKPKILFYDECEVFQQNIIDDYNIKQKYEGFVQKVISVSMWFYILFGYLFVQSVAHKNQVAFVILLCTIIFFSILIGMILVNGLKKKKKLIDILKMRN